MTEPPPDRGFKARVHQLACAGTLLTRLPWGWGWNKTLPPADAQAIWAYPLIGALIGGISATLYALLYSAGVSPFLAAFWTLAAQILLTGGLHEDGLADTADGLFGGQTHERRLEIMRDSRIGSYAALALILSTTLRGVAIATLNTPAAAGAAMMAACVLGRGGIVRIVQTNHPARLDGLAAALDTTPKRTSRAGLFWCVLITVLVLPLGQAIGSFVATSLTVGCIARLARKRIGGYTGDILGACVVLVETMVLSVLSL